MHANANAHQSLKLPNKALLPRLVNYQLGYKVEFVETATIALPLIKENENAKLPELPEASEKGGNSAE